ncbi:hypothetical protein [Microlunatus ginsengisoli]|uniref:ANTAR domain-containing protein n=1 Tax=Microlunatus ginsengisoli TaxID=363863 RepID=A0ABP6ZKT3_9ACTN
MDISTALLTHQLDHLTTTLAEAFDDDGPPVAGALAGLDAGLAAAVTSYRGLQITLAEHDPPVVVSVFSHSRDQPDSGGRDGLVTSLRLPLTLLDPTFQTGSRIVFYAATRGAFVDLAADISYALTPSAGHPATNPAVTERGRPAPQHQVSVDADPPPTCPTTGITGLAEQATINHAVGVLTDRGHHPDDVDQTLRRQAAAPGLTPHAFAVRLLAELSHPHRPRAHDDDDG